MNSTDKPERQLAGALFDDSIVRLAQDRKADGYQAFFPLSREPGVASYFEEPSVRQMAPEDFEFPGDGAATGLLEALTAYWTRQGEGELVSMGPRLKEIAEVLQLEAAAADGMVSILCYTMF